MKIIYDVSNILFASYLMNHDTNLEQGFTEEDLENLVRSVTISSLCGLLRTFEEDWRNLIIASDSNSWRNEHYKYYKANRKKSKRDSHIDFKRAIEFFGEFSKELRELLPGPVIKIYGCEADDIIGTLALKLSEEERVIIVSRDKDFIQLYRENIWLYDPFKKDFVEEVKVGTEKMIIKTQKDARKYLMYQILMGDSCDGVPNLKSDDDVFVNPTKRQRPFGIKTIKKQVQTKDDLKKLVDQYYDNWYRNKLMIDLTQIPTEYKEQIIDQYEKQIKNLTNTLDVSKMLSYCRDHNLYELEETFRRY